MLPRVPPVGDLQQDGPWTVTEMGRAWGFSHSPCHRHLRAFEQPRAISGDHAHVDAALGLTFQTLVFATMRAGDRDTVDAAPALGSRRPSQADARMGCRAREEAREADISGRHQQP